MNSDLPAPKRTDSTSTETLAAPRLDHEPPAAIAEQGWKYHHLGIPTQVVRDGEDSLPEFGLHVSGFKTSPYGIEWMRFERDSPVSDLIRKVPHIAFEVADLDAAIIGKDVLTPPNSPSDGVRVAMIQHNGAPIELLEFSKGRSRA